MRGRGWEGGAREKEKRRVRKRERGKRGGRKEGRENVSSASQETKSLKESKLRNKRAVAKTTKL